MTLGDYTPANILHNELKTLSFIMANSSLEESYPSLTNESENLFLHLSPSLKKHQHKPLGFFANLPILLGDNGEKQGKAYIGVDLIPKDKTTFVQASYSLTICQGNAIDTDSFLRKYHFDFAAPTSGKRRRDPPIFHLQYGGKLSPRHLQSGFDETLYEQKTSSWLSEPRLVFIPMSLALLLNIVFNEFPDDNNLGIRKAKEWRELVKRDENFLLRPYFRQCNSLLSAPVPSGTFSLLTSDFCYGR